jgi:dihydrofolate synthase/folylpolyglutamate synthase
MPKPHLVSYRERVAIDGEPIGIDAFAAAVSRVLPAIDRVTDRIGPPTEFEALTAAAVTELARRRVDLALVEVGMGGRLDATNALDLGVAAITNVQRDHERYLGRTLAAIGTEKAAIIKAGNLAVTGAHGRGLRPILERCAAVAAPLRRTGPRRPYRAVLRHADWEGIVIDAVTPERELRDLRIGLLGGHQASNAAVALALLDALVEDAVRRGTPLRIGEAAMRGGMSAARWPGRLELLDATHHGWGRVLLDGAHNPAGAAALAAALRELGVRRMPLVFGAMRGKRVHAVLRALAGLEPRPIFTAVDDPGALPPASLLRAWRQVTSDTADPGRTAPDPHAALEAAAAIATGQPTAVAGSLYLVGAVRGIITGEREGDA